MWKPYLYLTAFLLLSGCAKSVNKVLEHRKVAEIIPVDKKIIYQEDFAIGMTTEPESQLDITYLGCGGLFLTHQGEAILFDPFFSNKGFLSLPFKKIKISSSDIDFGLTKIENLAATRAVFNSHSHYDHLFDTPFIFKNKLSDQVDFHGSASANIMISPVINHKDRLKVITPSNWIKVSDYIRVMPILSAHAPHVKIGFPIKLYRGEGKVINKYDEPTSKTKAGKWKEGQTYSFLIDLRKDNETTFRIFLQSSASDSPIGFPNEAILAEKAIDLAILGAASFAYTKKKDYPWALLKKLQPKELIICHWEDFFRPYQEYPKKFVRLTNFKKFLPNLYQQYPGFYLPEPGVKINVTY